MDLDVRSVVLSAIFAIVAGSVLWPPGAVYWTEVAGEVGGGPTLAVVGAVAVLVGGTFEYLVGVDVASFVLGTGSAYLVGMALIEVTIAPVSPVHLVWYALLGICLVVGVASTVLYRHGDVQFHPVEWV